MSNNKEIQKILLIEILNEKEKKKILKAIKTNLLNKKLKYSYNLTIHKKKLAEL